MTVLLDAEAPEGVDLVLARVLEEGGPAWSAAVSTLGAADRDRLRTTDPARRAGLVTGRWELRRLAAARLAVPATDVLISARCPDCGGPHGAPTVQAPDGRGLAASLSHAPGAVLVAVSRTGRLGVDLVDPGATGFDGFDRQVLSAGEHARATAPAGGTPADADRWRARVWAAKEAALKALGVGLRVAPTDVVLDRPGDPGGTDAVVRLPDGRRERLRVDPVQVGTDRVAALARRGGASGQPR